MSDERRPSAGDIFVDALDVPSTDRAAWLDTKRALKGELRGNRMMSRELGEKIADSLGGRLALAAFLHPACRARALVVMSGHPGGLEADARTARLVRKRIIVCDGEHGARLHVGIEGRDARQQLE